MRFAASAAVIALAALAGCNRQPTVKMTNASVDDVMKSQAGAVKMKPGEWEVAAEVLDMKMEGAPAGMPAMPRQAKVTTKTCLTAAMVEKPTGMFGSGMQQFKDACTYDRFEMTGGKVDAAMHCNLPQGQKVTGTTRGTFTDTSMDAESESKVSGMPNGMSMTTRMKMSGHRTGDCQGGTAAAS